MSTVKQLRNKIKIYKERNCPPYSNKRKEILIKEAKKLGLYYKNKTVKKLKQEIKQYKQLHCYKIPLRKKELERDIRRKLKPKRKKIDNAILKEIEKKVSQEKQKHELTQQEYNKLQKEYKQKGEDIFSYEEISNLVKLLPNYLIPVGSYIRKKEFPGDLDIVTTKNLKEVLKWFDDNFKILKVLAEGNKHIDIRIEYNKKSLGINIWRTTPDKLIYLEFAYSYPQTLNIALRKKAKNMRYKLTQEGFFDSSGFLIPINNFKEIFDILKVEYRTPEEEELRETKYKNIKDGKKALELIRGENKELNKEDNEIDKITNEIVLLRNKLKKYKKIEEKIRNMNPRKKEKIKEVNIKFNSILKKVDRTEKKIKELEERRRLLQNKLGSGLLINSYNYNGGKIDNMIEDELKRDIIYGPVDRNRSLDNIILETMYGPIPEELKQQILGGIDFLYPVKKAYEVLENQYRKRFCDGRARPLKYGELHPLCANFEGPGTRIDLPEVRNYPPYNKSDACSKQHDLAYEKASKEKDSKLREQIIRKADEEIIKCLSQIQDEEPYKSLGLAGIESKIKLEDLIPTLTKLISGKSYFGHK